MTAEIRKSRYIYDHCSPAKGKCPEPYTWEDVLEGRFAELLDRLRFVGEVPAGVSPAEKRRLLGFGLVNCTSKNDQFMAEYRSILFRKT